MTSLEVVAYLSFTNDGSTWNLSESRCVGPIVPQTQCHPDRSGLVTTEKTGSVKISGRRTISNNGKEIELVEGRSIPVHDGVLTVVKARWKVAGGSVSPRIEEPTASETRLLFSEPGYAELVHDIALSFQFGDETYLGNSFAPKCSGLFGLFQTRCQTEYDTFPAGVLLGTSRNISLKKLVMHVNGSKREISPGEPLDFSWELGSSALFPQSPPLAFTGVRLSIAQKEPDLTVQITGDAFQYQLTHNSPFSSGMYVRPVAKIHSEFINQVDESFPTDSWKWIPFFGAFPSLVRVEIDPAQPPPIREGETIAFSGTILPLEGMGTGKIDAHENTIDLLDGYEVVGVNEVSWFGYLSERRKNPGPGSRVDWNFGFTPQTGSGSYVVGAEADIMAREKNTGTEAPVRGSGDVSLLVKPGLTIVSPLDGFGYPLGAEIEVVTGLDGTPEEWRNISWKLNGKPWKPDSTDGALTMDLLDGAFKAELRDLSWTQQGHALGSGNPFTYRPVATEDSSNAITAKAVVSLVEREPEASGAPDLFEFSGISQPTILAPKIELSVTDLFGPVPNENKKNLGAYIHFNIDNDNFNVKPGEDEFTGKPMPDYAENDHVEGENDLCSAKIVFPNLNVGVVSLRRDNAQLCVWSSPTKEASSAILVNDGERHWNLANDAEREQFEEIKDRLWVEGCGPDSSGLGVTYTYRAEKYSTADWVKCTFLSAACGRQPTPLEERVLLNTAK